MDRNDYLKLCQKVSMYTSKSMQIPSDLLVKHDNIAYLPYGYEMTFDKGKPCHNAILHDLRANSVTYADLERVEKYEQDNKIADSTV